MYRPRLVERVREQRAPRGTRHARGRPLAVPWALTVERRRLRGRARLVPRLRLRGGRDPLAERARAVGVHRAHADLK